ncbi:hypothetical protein [Brevibacillus brevis]|uniref:hypothetical protein n=1 Tax=Brevibacillus brevis TaxID=1393 RepID=UPI00165DDEEE|nr:hypothetical protein [Brevibacillus brevis]
MINLLNPSTSLGALIIGIVGSLIATAVVYPFMKKSKEENREQKPPINIIKQNGRDNIALQNSRVGGKQNNE